LTGARPDLAFGVLACWLLVGCAAPAASGGQRVLALDGDGLRVSVPGGWEATPSSDVGFGSGRVLFYASNQALETNCLQAVDEPRCTLPIEALADGGVLLLWATSRCAGVACELPSDDRLLISGREAARAVDTGACEVIGATEEDVYAVTVTPQRVDWIVVCAREPTADERAALATILDTVDWLTP
jgi:hypothetical protein